MSEKSHMQITKTDYLDFRFCRKHLWLKKNKPELVKGSGLSEFEKAIIKEGQFVDREARNLYPEGVLIGGQQETALIKTEEEMEKKGTIFQAAIKANNFYILTDVIKWNDETEKWDLYEVKATTKVKEEKFNSHIYDLAFQYNVCKMAGIDINKIVVTHMNSEYEKDGDIDYDLLFVQEDVTEKILEISDIVKEEMELMVGYLEGPEENECECRYRTRNETNHCQTFNYSNPDIPKYAIHDVTRISAKKILILMEQGVLDIKDIPDDFELSDNQMLQVQSAKKEKTIVDKDQVHDFLEELEFPLYFLDYESYLPAIPRFDRYSPYQNIVFQYSLHILREPGGKLEHKEFLATEDRDPSLDVVEALKRDIGPKGSVVVWHKPFEMGRNTELGGLNPTYAKFMSELNDRIVDLKEVFSKGMYVDPKFKGSASIKKVLPVIVPELSYDNMPINNGADANKKWGEMIDGTASESEAKKTQEDLLKYCEQDTLAMVRIWDYLDKLVT